MTDIERTICEILNQYCFDNIWNEYESEYRSNIKPMLLAERSKTGNFSMSGINIVLPETEVPFYIYGIGLNTLHGLADLFIPITSWLSLDKICNQYKIVLNIYTNHGKMFNKSSVYVRYDPTKTILLIAINTRMYNKLSTFEEIRNIYFTTYFDSDAPNAITIYSRKVPERDLNNTTKFEVQSYIDNLPDLSKCLTYINGYEVEMFDMGDIQDGDYIDIIYDENIQFSFDIDLTDNDEDFTFFSDKDKTYKRIVHIPKSFNPDNKVITHNTCDIFVRMKTPDAYKNKGLYLHRCADRTVTQITHNDFGIPMFIEDAYRDYLDTQDITLRVVGRIHDKNNILIRDKSYIDLLYTHNDNDILKMLKGNPLLPQLDFWKADKLEKSKYIEMMFDVPNIILPENMFEYVEGLGFYNVISLICKRIAQHDVSPLTRYISISKPLLYQNLQVTPILYSDGHKISNTNYSILSDQSSYCTIKFNDGYNLTKDKVTSILFIDGVNKTYSISPNSINRTMTIPYSSYVIYEEVDNNPVIKKGIDKSSTLGYKKVTNLVGNIVVSKGTGDSVILNFGSSTYGKKYIIQNKLCLHEIYNNIDDKILEGTPLYVDIEVPLYNDSRNVPVFEITSSLVFLNGCYLIDTLDYHIVDVFDHVGNLAFRQLVIQNMQYLKESGNEVEILLHTSSQEDVGYEFIINNKTNHKEKPNLWFPTLSTLHADGRLISDVRDMGPYLEVTDEVREGAPYEIQTNIPVLIKDFVEQYHVNDDKERLYTLNKYFYGIDNNIPEILILDHSHQVYSIYISLIIRDLVRRSLKLSYDPDENRIASQLTEYEIYKKYDQLYSHEVDLRFVDIFATYRNYSVSDIELYRMIHAIIRVLSPVDNIHSGEIINEQ